MTHSIKSEMYVVISTHGYVHDAGSMIRSEAVSYVTQLDGGDRIARFDVHDFMNSGASSLRDVTEEIVREAYDDQGIPFDSKIAGWYLGIWPDDEDGAATKADFDRDMRLADLMMGDAA